MILPVIMAGGSGSRLWPLSRKNFPKQFHGLVSGDSSLLVDTIKRLNDLEHLPPVIICNEEHRFLVAEQLRKEEYRNNGIILEPFGRNTCPAIALASLHALSLGEDPYLLVLAADHAIGDNECFLDTIRLAMKSAEEGHLVTFGIVPTEPETGYGYIKKGTCFGDNIYSVDSFKEKPDVNTATVYVNSGEYLWNSGMFLFKASVFLAELNMLAPDIYNSCKQAFQLGNKDLDFIRVNAEAFSECRNVSVDYAVMEKTDNCVVVPLDAKWNDVGSWSALWELSQKDEDDNYFQGDVIALDSSGSYVRSDSGLVATIGISNLIVVNTKDALLVAERSHVQDVKKIIDVLNLKNRRETSHYVNEYRSWGEIERIDSHDGYIVNRIIISPKSKIAKQIHYHRSEHWIVVSGTAIVEIDQRSFVLTENESTFIKVGQEHSITNPGVIPLIMIEIQSGKVINESDVKRI